MIEAEIEEAKPILEHSREVWDKIHKMLGISQYKQKILFHMEQLIWEVLLRQGLHELGDL